MMKELGGQCPLEFLGQNRPTVNNIGQLPCASASVLRYTASVLASVSNPAALVSVSASTALVTTLAITWMNRTPMTPLIPVGCYEQLVQTQSLACRYFLVHRVVTTCYMLIAVTSYIHGREIILFSLSRKHNSSTAKESECKSMPNIGNRHCSRHCGAK